MKGKVLVQSNNIDTYVNIVAAMCLTFKDIKEIRLSFVSSPVNENLIDSIQQKLSANPDSLIYKHAARVHLSGESTESDNTQLSTGWDVLDVSAVSKEVALNIVAATIDNQNIKVCSLQWLKRFEKGEEWLLTNDNHEYKDLLSDGALSKLYKNYLQKKSVIYIFGSIFLVLLVTAIAKYLMPSILIPADIVNVLSLLIGAAGLYLAAESLRK
ncbi:hypothetical protein ACUMO5_004511 [Vibrio parahaemolyticus]|nr:hypothetical protein [Vibrio parahaemolyticus]EIC2575737.1 hypothetical protein [Vibrio parahaemolyticus]EID0039410.1 hypothetical protein [Vibrio parahaemolyticus]MBM4914650.1 hypothetical protein [Vibrio parahaemolyticus]